MSKDLVLKTPTLRRGSSFLSYRLCSGFRQVPRNSDMVKVRFTSFFVDYLRCLAFCNLAEKPEAGGMEGVPYRSTMNKKIDKAALASRILALEGISSEDKSALLELLNEQKRYGLVWEDSPEEVETLLREKLPVLTEDTTKRLLADTTDEVPNHILIEGDNYPALVALQYAYEGKVDVIYIDPPYNTGNKDFVYNDSYVDSEDSYRHSKWLSFMSKRLRIAKRLLSDRGVIFISIDDNEQADLKLLCDEVFGGNKFIGAVVWFKKRKGSFLSNKLVSMTEYLLPYVNNTSISLYGGSTNNTESQPIVKRTNTRKILNIKAGLVKTKLADGVYPKGNYGEGTSGSFLVNDVIVKNGIIINNFSIEAPFVWSQDFLEQEIQNGTELLINTKNFQIRVIRHNNDSYKAFPSFIDGREIGATNEDAYELLKNIFSTDSIFSYSKPVNLIKKVIESVSHFNKKATILDFFAGSGTTLHATMQLNAEDGGKRQCILVTNNENNICEEVTYERNKRVIQGYMTPKGQQVEGLKNNNLRYYKVDFVERKKTAANQKELMRASTDLLCIKENLYQEENCFEGLKLHEQIARCFSDGVEGGKKMLVIYEPNAIPVLVKRIEQMTVDKENKLKVYVMAEGQYPYTEDFESVLSKVELRAMPHALYQAIRQVLPPLAEAENTEPEMEVSEEEADGSIYKSEEL